MHTFKSISTCNLCGNTEVTPISDIDRNGKPLTTVMCTFCGLVRTDPLPTKEEINEFYQTKYWNEYKDYHPKLKHIYRNAHRALNRYKRDQHYFKNAQSILEIGSGRGEFVYLLNYLNLHAQGLEPHTIYSQYSREEFGIPVTSAMLEQASYAPNTFDLIASHHVVEHLCDPAIELRRMNRWLKEGGHLIVEVPNIEANRHAPKNRFHFAHIYNFNAITLEELAYRQGFSFIRHTLGGDHENHLHMIFQKKGLPTGQHKYTAAKLKENFEHLHKKVHSHTSFDHYLTLTPYLRTFNKLRNGISEKLIVRNFKQGKDVANYVFKASTCI